MIYITPKTTLNRMVVSLRVPSMGQKDLFENYSHLIELYMKQIIKKL